MLSRGSSPWRIAELLGRVGLVEGALEDLPACADAVSAFAPHAVAHLGWEGVANVDHGRADQARNIGWTGELVEVARNAGARVFVGVGSQAEYGPQPVVLGPDSATEPTTLYGEAKLTAGRTAARMANKLGMRFVWLRLFSVFGPADHPYWMIPSLIGSLLKGEKPALTAGEQLWDFLYVEDAARAIRLALETESAQGVYALGSGQAPSLRSTIELIRDAIDPKLPLGFGEVAYRPGQVMRLEADISALTRDCRWKPLIDRSAAVARTVEWYRDNDWVFERERPL
jgi:nucleoside-diphosphate-sugar epimerase